MKKVSIAVGKLTLIISLVSAFFGLSNAQETSSAQFLKLGAGARAAAMADAFSSVADDVTAAYWNPAGLTRLHESQIALMQNSALLDTNYQYLGGAFAGERRSYALSIYRMDYGSIERYSNNPGDPQDGTFTAGSLAGSFSMGMKMTEDFDLGFSAKFIQESIESESASSFAGDFGALYRMGETGFGLSVQNVGPGLKFVQEKGDLPQTVRAGVNHKFFENNLLVAFDVSKPNDNDATLHTAAEYHINPMFTLRGGYQATPGNSLDVGGLTGLTAGVGLNVNSFSFDYAFVPYGDLGSTHRFSVLFKFSPR